MLRRIVVTSFLLAVGSPFLMGQISGRISGTVSDQTGAVLPDASVSLRLPGSDKDLFATSTNADGLFALPGVRPDSYDVVVAKSGFKTLKITAFRVDGARDTVLDAIKLELAAVVTVIEVSGEQQGTNTVSAQLSNTLRTEQIQNLPMIGRNPVIFIVTQPGVNSGGGNTTINGMRVSMNNLTLDGINIQDNFIRDNALDFVPNRPVTDSVAEMTVITSNSDSNTGFGASQINLSTPSGTNKYHGAMLWTNRNSKLAANSWFNNRDGLALPRLNQNQVGASVGGPIKRDKLFFFADWEILRNRQQTSLNRTILTDDARQGIFTYRDSGGAIQKRNVLNLQGVTPDPYMQGLLAKVPGGSSINNFRLGDSSDSFLRNTAGYSFLGRNNFDRDYGLGKIDYNLSTKNSLAVTYNGNRETVDRGDLTNDYQQIPLIKNDSVRKLLSAAWRWNPSSRLTNEARWGFNLSPGIFANPYDYGSLLVTGMSYSNPVNTQRAQGRYTNTYNFSDNLSFLTGKHTLQFGFQAQRIGVESFDQAGITPSYGIGTGTGNQGLTAAQLPGIGATDLTAANLLLATLAGYVTSSTQNFNVSSRTSGFLPNQQFLRNYTLNQYAFFAQDRYKLFRRLTLTMGLRWDYYSPVDEKDSLALFPVLQGNNAIKTILDQNGTFDFAGNSVGRTWYKKDRNNFAPNFGFAWDIFGSGKTVFRGGYSIAFVNDQNILALQNSANTNTGLQATAARTGLTGRVTASLPSILTPVFKVPRTYADNYALNTSSAIGIPDPGLVTPYVQQWNIGIQQEIKHNVISISWVGNHATKQYRAFDFNQVIIRENGFLDDFIRARNNGFIAQKATGVFNPAYNAALAGSQILTVFPQLASGGLLTNSTVLTSLQTGAVGDLANTYQTNGLNGPIGFYRNPNALGTNMMTNYGNSVYNGLQVDVMRRLSNLTYQVNYTYSHVFSDAGGSQSRFDPFLDLGNGKIERSRVGFSDLTHVFKVLADYPLPFGPGQHWTNRKLSKFIGGWRLGGIFALQSGNPFSVLSARGTLNRSGRSANNTADTALNAGQLSDIFQFRMTPTGPYFVSASAIGPDGRAVAADGATPFSGQVFFQPGPGAIGALQRNRFSGPSIYNLNMNIVKRTTVFENQYVELRMDVINALNNPTFSVGDQTLTSTQFGRITGFNTTGIISSSRVVQLGLRYQF